MQVVREQKILEVTNFDLALQSYFCSTAGVPAAGLVLAAALQVWTGRRTQAAGSFGYRRSRSWQEKPPKEIISEL